ncbi:aldo/keto reductase [Flexithrix dorotheae]|uniref:aldo/keto reductase n=1 Tax=Flexithrix dorotheae TaxID=70993 RepID=UPI00037177AF|nr:aldo/keto reductase [Flexithrix dorotheae]
MKYRKLGKTGYNVSEVSLGTWQVGGRWGEPFNEKNAEAIINESIDLGVNFIDTADVYGDGMSEKVVGRVVKNRSEEVVIATKSGRRLNPHNAEGYNEKNIRGFIEDSLKNMGLEQIDLLQLHCPPTSVYESSEIFDSLEKIKSEGKIKHFGVSVEKVTEAEKAVLYPGVSSVQIIFNMFRQKPSDSFFDLATKKNIGILARVPLASGLLTGKFSKASTFDKDDHRNFNREGKAFDKGETFSGVPYDLGLEAVNEIKAILNKEEITLYALKWVLMFEAISCVIPGASTISHAQNNILASEMDALTAEELEKIKGVYEKHLKEIIHPQW